MRLFRCTLANSQETSLEGDFWGWCRVVAQLHDHYCSEVPIKYQSGLIYPWQMEPDTGEFWCTTCARSSGRGRVSGCAHTQELRSEHGFSPHLASHPLCLFLLDLYFLRRRNVRTVGIWVQRRSLQLSKLVRESLQGREQVPVNPHGHFLILICFEAICPLCPFQDRTVCSGVPSMNPRRGPHQEILSMRVAHISEMKRELGKERCGGEMWFGDRRIGRHPRGRDGMNARKRA